VPDTKIQVEVTIREHGGFGIRDPLGREHFAYSEVELARLLVELSQDPNMPQPQHVRPSAVILEDLGAQLANDALPPQMRAAAPLVGRAFADIGLAAAGGARSVASAVGGWIDERKQGKRQAQAAENASRSRSAKAAAENKTNPPSQRPPIPRPQRAAEPPTAEKPKRRRSLSLRFS
jgi:hypothetical protein